MINPMISISPILQRMMDKAKNLVLLALDQLLMLCYQPGTAGGVVLIRLDNIGDFILWLDTAKIYRQFYQDQKITLVASASWAELAGALPYWDEIIVLNPRSLYNNRMYRWKHLRQLRRYGFETAIQPNYSREFFVDSLINVIGASRRIGSRGDSSNIPLWQKRISDRWYTQLIVADSDAKMELERNAEFISNLTGSQHIASLPMLPLITSLPEHLMIGQAYFIVFPGASWHGRQWSAEQFALTAQTLCHKKKLRIVICGGPDDLAICAKIARIIGGDAIDLSGQTTLLELIELIRLSNFLISNETSAIHIAAAVRVPSICILGGGHFGRFMPYPSELGQAMNYVFHQMPCFGCNWQCTQPHFANEEMPCIKAVTVEQVCDAVHQLSR